MRVIDLIESEAFNERVQLRAIVGAAPPQQGYTIDEVRKAIKVLARIDQPAGTPLRLENDEWECLRDAVARQRWAVASTQIVDLVDKVVNAKALDG